MSFTKICERCGKEFTLTNIAYERRGQGKYCSKTCSARRKKVNEKFFCFINSEKKAYWLGFLFADGCNTKKSLALVLNIKDLEHLKKFKSDVSSNHKLLIKNNKGHLRISNPSLCKDLSKLGCIPRKTFVLKYPKINSKYNKDFIRGFFDGDGWISPSVINNKTYWSWGIFCASRPFLESIQKVLKENDIFIKITGKENAWNLRTGKKSTLLQLFNFLYGESTILLNRKKEKFLKAVDK